MAQQTQEYPEWLRFQVTGKVGYANLLHAYTSKSGNSNVPQYTIRLVDIDEKSILDYDGKPLAPELLEVIKSGITEGSGDHPDKGLWFNRRQYYDDPKTGKRTVHFIAQFDDATSTTENKFLPNEIAADSMPTATVKAVLHKSDRGRTFQSKDGKAHYAAASPQEIHFPDYSKLQFFQMNNQPAVDVDDLPESMRPSMPANNQMPTGNGQQMNPMMNNQMGQMPMNNGMMGGQMNGQMGQMPMNNGMMGGQMNGQMPMGNNPMMGNQQQSGAPFPPTNGSEAPFPPVDGE